MLRLLTVFHLRKGGAFLQDTRRWRLGCRVTYQANRRAAPMRTNDESRAGPSG